MPKPKNPRGITGFYHAEYQAWQDMKRRCLNKNNPRWASYGGRGIAVYPPWIASFREFFNFIGPRPSAKYSLDRIDNDGNYEPGNVRWATREQQQRNRWYTHKVTYNGQTKPVLDWADELGISPRMLWTRIKRGWSPKEALTIAPYKRYKGAKEATINGSTKSIRQWAIDLGFTNIDIIYDRLSYGWTIERALLTPARKYSKT